MRRCYRGAALALGGILMTGFTSHNSCSFGALTVYAAEDTLTEELETAFQEEVQTGEENVETDIPEEEITEEKVSEEEVTEEEIIEEKVSEEEAAEEEIMVEEIFEEEITEEEIAEKEITGEEITEEETGQAPEICAGLEDQEYQVLLKIVEAEAGGEDFAGRMLVANVVMNRVRSSRFPNTVTEVVYQRCGGKAQFSPVSDGRIDRVSVSPETVEAVARVMNGEDSSAGALYFRSVYSNSGWFDRTLSRVMEHGNHVFYTM